MFSIILGMLQGKNITQPVNIVVGIAEALSHKYSIPQVKKQKHVIGPLQVFLRMTCRVQNALWRSSQKLRRIRKKQILLRKIAPAVKCSTGKSVS